MTREELALVTPGQTIYLPDGWDVVDWLAVGVAGDTDYYTLVHPPARQNATRPRKPYVVHYLDMGPATLDVKTAWQYNFDRLVHRAASIYETHINPLQDANE